MQKSGDILRGYRVSAIEIKDESFLSKGEEKFQLITVISKDKNDSIKGAVLEITEEELFLVDKYETRGYKRVKVVLESGKVRWIYIAVETI